MKPTQGHYLRYITNILHITNDATKVEPNAGSGVVRIDQLLFLTKCCTRRLNQSSCLLYLSILLLCYCLLGPLFMYC